jgi:hypothetical protein
MSFWLKRKIHLLCHLILRIYQSQKIFKFREKKNEDEFKQVINDSKSTNSEIKNKKTSLEESVIDKIN